MATTKPPKITILNAADELSTKPDIILRTKITAYVTGLNWAIVANQSGINASGKRAGLIINIGKPRKLTVPQKVSWDFAAAANITDIPENPIENRTTIAMIGAIINKFGIVTPIASAIPKIRLA